MDIQGYIVEKLSGQSLPDFMQQRILGPLGMKDSSFFVPPEKRNRIATLYEEDAKGESDLCWHDSAIDRPWVARYASIEPPHRLSGSGEAADVIHVPASSVKHRVIGAILLQSDHLNHKLHRKGCKHG